MNESSTTHTSATMYSTPSREWRPIIFSSEMVRAILDGRKTMTRRVIKVEWSRCLDLDEPEDVQKAIAQCPYGKSGDLLWVRETWIPNYYIDGRPEYAATILYTKRDMYDGVKLKPSIFMPRWASRISLRITNIRVERLQNISELDCENELGFGPYLLGNSAYQRFHDLWDRINSKRGYPWSSNPFVWVIEFERIENG